MRDPFSWSLPLGRIFGVTIKVHFLFLLFILAMWLRAATSTDPTKFPPGSANAVLVLLGLTFLAVLLHEFGHVFAARWAEGEAEEVLLWPLGGLARCDVPHTPKANFITASGGPAMNLALCLITGTVLAACAIIPPLSPWPWEAWIDELHTFDGQSYLNPIFYSASSHQFPLWQLLVAQFFWINWFLFLINVVLVGFPLDGGQMLQAALWPRMGYRDSMRTAIFVGFVVMFVVGLVGLVWNEVMVLCLAAFIYFACRHQWIVLEMGAEDSLFGYDFSQGYTSLEPDDEPKPRRKRLNFIQRWLQKRAQRRLQREMEQAQQDERRMDELLDKIQRSGRDSLTEEEHRFLKRVSDRFRNRP